MARVGANQVVDFPKALLSSKYRRESDPRILGREKLEIVQTISDG